MHSHRETMGTRPLLMTSPPPCHPKTFPAAVGLILTIPNTLILLFIFDWHEHLMLLGMLGLLTGLWLLSRYGCWLESFKTGAWLIWFGAIFMCITHLALITLGPAQAISLTELQIHSGQIEHIKIYRRSTKSASILKINLVDSKQYFELSAYQIGMQRLEQLQQRLSPPASVKLWCRQLTTFGSCEIKQLQYKDQILVSPEQIAHYRAEVWVKLVYGCFLFVIVGLITILLTLLKRLILHALLKFR